jgi:DNA-directed RNA polymerase specialized sigma24 family protein
MQEIPERLPDPAMGQDREAQKRQDLETPQAAVSHLPADQRLLLRLRFHEGLTLKKIAQLKYHGDVNGTWRHVQAAMEALFKNFGRASAAKKRKN